MREGCATNSQDFSDRLSAALTVQKSCNYRKNAIFATIPTRWIFYDLSTYSFARNFSRTCLERKRAKPSPLQDNPTYSIFSDPQRYITKDTNQ